MVFVGYKRLSSGVCEQQAYLLGFANLARSTGAGERFRWGRKTDSCILVIDGVLLVRLP